jgi:hypothetical protein
MVKLMDWFSTNPEAPKGAWCKDFGTFELVGQALILISQIALCGELFPVRFPLTRRDQAA